MIRFQDNDQRRGCATVASRLAFSDGHTDAVRGRPMRVFADPDSAEARSYRNGYEAGKRAK